MAIKVIMLATKQRMSNGASKNTLPRNQINLLPQKPGVYFLLNSKGDIFYIGKSTNIKKRVHDHMRAKTFHPVDFAQETASISWVETANEVEALIKEAEYIKQYLPKYNVLLKDGKNYFYVAISRTRGSLSFVSITHQPVYPVRSRPAKGATTVASRRPASNGASENEFDYIGPFTDGRSLKKLLRYLRKLFPYYTTKKHSKLLCQYCHLGLCPGPSPDITNYKKSVLTLKKILQGKLPSVRKQLAKEMKTASQEMRFEDAKRFKELGDSLDEIFANKDALVHAILPQQSAAARELAQILGIKKLVETIEGYDISNIQGRQPTASEVRFLNGKPDKSLYRKFHIRLLYKKGLGIIQRSAGTPSYDARQSQAVGSDPNDFAMMREVITRRLGHPEWPYPDMILIDGGKGQLSSANAAMQTFALFHKIPLSQMPKIASIAKQHNELFIPGREGSIKLDNGVSPAVRNLLMYVRDESHRFAITYHRKLHRKTFAR